jgi:hypothetical protein
MEQSDILVWVIVALAAVLTFGGIYLVQLAMKIIGDSVPQSAVEGLLNQATVRVLEVAKEMTAGTKNTWDDGIVDAMIKRVQERTETPTLPAPLPPVVTVSHPPVGNTGTSTTDVSTPPFVPMPEVPHTIVRNFGVTDSSFEKTVNGTRRVIHSPVNTSPLFSNQDAAGKEYPYPSVNVNSAYGVQFDISWIAGAWGFTILETLVSGTAYKVRLDYTAQVTGAKVDSLAEWLSHELDVNGKVTGVSQGVMNGVSYAEWGITGGHLPLMITPRLRCLWALGQDESKVSWQRLTITPVDYGANG